MLLFSKTLQGSSQQSNEMKQKDEKKNLKELN